MTMTQTADYPQALDDLVRATSYKRNWQFYLADIDRGQGSKGLTLVIVTETQDSYHPERTTHVTHYMIVPAAGYDHRSWQRWLLDQILLVESHEACEFLQIDGRRPYAPSHGHGNDPYLIREIGTDIDRRTSFRNELNPA